MDLKKKKNSQKDKESIPDVKGKKKQLTMREDYCPLDMF